MRQEDNSIITLCPSIGQFFINELPLLLLCVAMLLIGGLPGCAYSTLLLEFAWLFDFFRRLFQLLDSGNSYETYN